VGADAAAGGAAGGVESVEHGGQAMRQLATNALLVVVLSLIGSIGTAFAECAWVLWAYSLDQRVGEQYSPEAARPTNQDCLAAVRAMAVAVKNRGLAVSGGDPEHPELLFREGTTSFKYFCLPDTIDPRGAKGT
jgi:hypothetical protein